MQMIKVFCLVNGVRYSMVLLSCLCILVLQAQSFSGHPPGLAWRKLSSPDFTLFFPKIIEPTALRVADYISHTSQDSALGTHRFKVNIVLQNQTVNSNGYVGIAPFMSEYFLNPPHDPYTLGSVNWAEVLAIHEYRHVLQYTNSRKGINKFLYTLFGEEFWAGSMGMVVPDWFFEGDAVYAETKYTLAGRGRLANFSMPFRALSAANKHWNYKQARNGSFKKLVPNQYAFGYPMVKYIYDHFGAQAWNKIYADAIQYNNPLFPFNAALKKNTGLSVQKIYNKSIQQLDIEPLAKPDLILKTNTSKINIVQYKTPNRLPDGSLLYLEASRNTLPKLVLETGEKKKTLFWLGLTENIEYGFTYPIITWERTSTDTRWANRDYSDIWMYNLLTGQKQPITHRQKFFNPTPSNDARKIVCVEYLPSGQTQSVVLDLKGNILFRHSYPLETQITFPTFLENDEKIISVLRDRGTSAIIIQQEGSSHYQYLSKPVPAVMSNLFVLKDQVFFSSDIEGLDNLYKLELSTLTYYKMTHDKIGIQQFSLTKNELLYNQLSDRGLEIRSKMLSDLKPENTQIFSPVVKRMTDTLEPRAARTPYSKYTITDADLLDNRFRVYGWGWNPQAGINTFSIKGRNVLNTLDASLNYAYQTTDQSHTVGFESSWGIAYPIISTGINQTIGRNVSRPGKPDQDSIKWNETVFRIGASIPWRWIHQNSNTSLLPYLSYGGYQPDYKKGDRPHYQTTHSIRSGIRFSNQRVHPSQQVSSRWFQVVDFQWNKAINHAASSFNLLSQINVPGLARTHSLEINYDFNQQNLSDPYIFSNRARFIHGYKAFSSDRLHTFRSAYHFPLIYPDLGVNGLFFIKRIRNKVFFEQASILVKGSNRNLNISYSMLGDEMLFDTHLFNIVPISMGFRYNHPLDTDLILRKRKSTVEFVVESFF